MPRVTFGVTTYNVSRYLRVAMDGLLAQDFTDFEIVVSDNASTDDTWDIVEDFVKQDSRIRAYRNETNQGFAANYARTVELAQGEFYRFCSHDDLIAPTMLSSCVKALDEAGPRAVLAFPDTHLIDGEGRDLGPWLEDVELKSRWAPSRVGRFAAHSHLCNENFGVIRTAALRRTHLHVNSLVSPDFLLLNELAMLGKFVKVPGYLFSRRMHSEGTHQGDKSLADVAEYLEPTAANEATLAKFTSIRMIPQMLMDVRETPWLTRASCAGAFVARYGARRLSTRLKQRFLRPGPLPPWESGVPTPYPGSSF